MLRLTLQRELQKVEKQIKALYNVITEDISIADRQMYQQELNSLETTYNQLEEQYKYEEIIIDILLNVEQSGRLDFYDYLYLEDTDLCKLKNLGAGKINVTLKNGREFIAKFAEELNEVV